MNEKIPFNQTFFNDMSVQFDTHVRQSIPLYDEFVEYIANWIVKFEPTASILDICGSTGELGRLLYKKGFRGEYTCLDGSPKMCAIGQLRTGELGADAYNHIKFSCSGFMAEWTDETGFEVKMFEPEKKYDIVLELLGFQFFTETRRKEIEYIRNRCLKDDGVFITCEKFNQSSELRYQHNEQLKDARHKSKHFTTEEIKKKEIDVLSSMRKYMYNYRDYKHLLNDIFFLIREVYKVGNFSGFMCTRGGYMHPATSECNRLIDNEFNL